jgi:hypothetical protein
MLCPFELLLIITVWIWYFVDDHYVVQYTPAVAMERMSIFKLKHKLSYN